MNLKFKEENSGGKMYVDTYSSNTAYFIHDHLKDENKLTIDYDYKVELPDSGKSFTISDFVSKEKRCNTGFLCNDTFNDLESYKLNGEVTRTSGVLEIHQ